MALACDLALPDMAKSTQRTYLRLAQLLMKWFSLEFYIYFFNFFFIFTVFDKHSQKPCFELTILGLDSVVSWGGRNSRWRLQVMRSVTTVRKWCNFRTVVTLSPSGYLQRQVTSGVMYSSAHLYQAWLGFRMFEPLKSLPVLGSCSKIAYP